jgi:hypothetical protein
MFITEPSGHKSGPWLLTGLLAAALITVITLNVKVVADGYLSHAVNVQLKIARYKWQSGNVRGATDALWHTVPKAVEAGWRWQVAQSYFLLARSHMRFDDPQRANQLCRAGLAALGFGRYDHTRNGTSTTVRKCDELRP